MSKIIRLYLISSRMNFLLIIWVVQILGCQSTDKSTVDISKAIVRNAHSMAYNVKDSSVYLFGGASDEMVASDLWKLVDNKWHLVSDKNEPHPRTFAAFEYDRANDRLILFGGSKVLFGESTEVENLLNDTWQFKDNSWQKIETTHAPSPRAEMSLVYDLKRKLFVLFGGYTIQNGEYVKLGDTWEFVNNEWQLISTNGPTQRHGAGMVYHQEIGYSILFGGSTIDGQYGTTSGQTWKWDGEVWTKIQLNQPAGVFNPAMTYDKLNSIIFRFGGWNGESRINDTWIYSDKWEKLQPQFLPAARNHSNAVYDEKNGRMILFGGHDGENVFGDLWEFKDGAWRKLIDLSPKKRIMNGH